MRRGVIFFVLFNVATVSYLVYTFWTLITLLLIDGSADAISRAEIPGEKSDPFAGKKQLIPKIIHQTYANTSLPQHWKAAQQSCLNLHKDYEYKVCRNKRFPAIGFDIYTDWLTG
jgi:mannosyltransferase OCH1-like enzyme